MVLLLHNISHRLWKLHIPLLPRAIYGFNRIAFSVVLPPSAVIGKDVVLGYSGLGTVIHARAVIGNRVVIGAGITIGGKTPHYEVPVIEDDVDIGAGARILGPISVGRGAIIGANAVVVKNVPPGAIVAGVPARLIRMREGYSLPDGDGNDHVD
jgi:serine O-acetyltransferase